MRVLFKPETLVLVPESEAEREDFSAWRESSAGHVFHFDGSAGKGGALFDLGSREEACREPINIVFDQCDPQWLPITNLALTPFTLRGKSYMSAEGFWQGLKFVEERDRARIARLWGTDAKHAGQEQPQPREFEYAGAKYHVGSYEHRELMLEACRAKFKQNAEAREALLATGNRPLTHRVRRDSKTIPGVVMAEFWMRIRAGLNGEQEE